MQPNGHRASFLKKQYSSLNKNGTSKSSYSLNHRPVINYNNSPRALPDMRDRDDSVSNVGERMRLMKSKLNNISIHSRNGWNQNNLYPSELIFLLSNQQGNVEHMRKLIQEQKKRVNRDFQNFSREIIHMIEDLKLSFNSKLDFVFRDYINIYKNLKDQVIRMRQARKRILMNRPIQQYQHRSPYKSQVQINNNTSNLNLLQQISKDEDYFKNHKIYEQVTNAYFEAIGPIMNDAQSILSIGSQLQFYKDQKCNHILNNIRNNFFTNTKNIFDNQLDNLVTQSTQIIEDNNMLLKDLNEEPKNQRNQYSNYVVNQRQQKSSVIPVSINNNKKKKVQGQFNNPYGFQVPTFKNNYNPQPEKPRGLRPSSSSQHLKYRQRPQSQWSSRKNLVQPQKYTITTTSPQKIQHYNVTRDQQNMIVQWAQSPRFKTNQSITSSTAQDILLCLIFVGAKYIAAGSKDRNIYIYSINTGRIVQTLSGHRASVCSLSNFNNFIASGGDNGCSSLILWETHQWRLKKKINLHSAALTCIIDLLDGTHLATGGYDKKIFVFNYKKQQTAFEVISNKSAVTSMAICQQSRKLISAGLDSTLTIWNIFTRNGEIDAISLQRIVTNCGLVCSLRPLLLSPDMVLVGNKEGKVFFVNNNSGQILKTLTVGRGSVIQMGVIERKNKPQFPLILSCCSNEREMIIARSESGVCQSTKIRINLSFGCGIGPKVVLQQTGLIGIVNQSTVQKQLTIHTMELG